MRKTIKILWMMLLIGLFLCGCQTKESGILHEIRSLRGYTRVVSQEEYDFYQYFVERDLAEEISVEELDKRVKEYAGKVNAVFYLGNRLDLCEPYSFSALKLRMEQENVSRQAKIAEGEVVYGLQQFTLENYFQYVMDQVQVDIQGYLQERADAEILKMAKTYYREHKEEFRGITEIVFDETLDGVTETITADADTLGLYGKADMGLADFLGTAEVGQIYTDVKNGQQRSVVVKNVTYSKESYKSNAEMALYRLIRDELYETLIQTVNDNNPLEFDIQ